MLLILLLLPPPGSPNAFQIRKGEGGKEGEETKKRGGREAGSGERAWKQGELVHQSSNHLNIVMFQNLRVHPHVQNLMHPQNQEKGEL